MWTHITTFAVATFGSWQSNMKFGYFKTILIANKNGTKIGWLLWYPDWWARVIGIDYCCIHIAQAISYDLDCQDYHKAKSICKESAMHVYIKFTNKYLHLQVVLDIMKFKTSSIL